MKRVFIILSLLFCSLVLVSCESHTDLYKQTDYFVGQLSTSYQSYGLQGLSYKRYADGGKYSITPMGRLIIVKIEKYAPDSEYDTLRRILEKHYKGDYRVNKVYINQGGTVVIDCGN